MENAFMCSIKERLENQNKMPAFYRYVNDALGIMADVAAASEFLSTLTGIHPSISFTMELENNSKLPFLGMEIIWNSCLMDGKVFRKPTDTILILHYQSHADVSYKQSLLNTMLNCAFKLSRQIGSFFTKGVSSSGRTTSTVHHPAIIRGSTTGRRRIAWSNGSQS